LRALGSCHLHVLRGRNAHAVRLLLYNSGGRIGLRLLTP
jgi:hypothetical protein